MVSILKYFPLSVIFILSLISLSAQDRQSDSLLIALKKSAADTNKVNLLNTIVLHYQYSDPPKAMEYALQMIELSKATAFNYGLAMAGNADCSAYFDQKKQAGNTPKGRKAQLSDISPDGGLHDHPDPD